MIALFDHDSLIYQAVPHIVDTDDIRKWFRDGRSKDWMREEIVILVLNKIEQMGNNIFKAIEESGIEIDGFEYFLTNDITSIRRQCYPEYKMNRRKLGPLNVNGWKEKNMKRVVNRVRRRLLGMNFADSHPDWEADDLIADRARELKYTNLIIISMDKDMKQIPGLFFDYYREDVLHNYCKWPKSSEKKFIKGEPVLDQYGNPEKEYRGLNVITELQADRFKWLQVLMGDGGDNIKGIKGVGKVRANKVIDASIDNDFRMSTILAYSEHYSDVEEAKYEFELNLFLVGLGTDRNIDHLNKYKLTHAPI